MEHIVVPPSLVKESSCPNALDCTLSSQRALWADWYWSRRGKHLTPQHPKWGLKSHQQI